MVRVTTPLHTATRRAEALDALPDDVNGRALIQGQAVSELIEATVTPTERAVRRAHRRARRPV